MITSPSNEFAEQWKAIREGFMSMKLSIQKERDAMEKLWKAREKQLEKVLLNAAHVSGSIEGIAGSDSVDLNLLGRRQLMRVIRLTHHPGQHQMIKLAIMNSKISLIF